MSLIDIYVRDRQTGLIHKVGDDRHDMDAITRAIHRKAGKMSRTITHTYNEQHPTNKDYLIAVLTDSIDDGGASYESMARYDIKCPYFGNDDCLNEHEGNEYGTKEYTEGCVRCKLAWLDREYDTYPSDDGRWDGEKE